MNHKYSEAAYVKANLAEIDRIVAQMPKDDFVGLMSMAALKAKFEDQLNAIAPQQPLRTR